MITAKKFIQTDTTGCFIDMNLSAGVFRPKNKTIFSNISHKQVYCTYVNLFIIKVSIFEFEFGYYELWYLDLPMTSSIRLHNIAITFISHWDLPHSTAILGYLVSLPVHIIGISWSLSSQIKFHMAAKTKTLDYLLNYADKKSLVHIKKLIEERLAH